MNFRVPLSALIESLTRSIQVENTLQADIKLRFCIILTPHSGLAPNNACIDKKNPKSNKLRIPLLWKRDWIRSNDFHYDWSSLP